VILLMCLEPGDVMSLNTMDGKIEDDQYLLVILIQLEFFAITLRVLIHGPTKMILTVSSPVILTPLAQSHSCTSPDLILGLFMFLQRAEQIMVVQEKFRENNAMT